MKLLVHRSVLLETIPTGDREKWRFGRLSERACEVAGLSVRSEWLLSRLSKDRLRRTRTSQNKDLHEVIEYGEQAKGCHQ